jgi:peptidoglycan hydrolase CwlO-like protein
MKTNTIKYVMLLPLLYISIGLMAQDEMNRDQLRKNKADSLAAVEQNAKSLAELESEKDAADKKAEEAAKVEDDAKAAAKEAKAAYRAEKKAQKAREKADRQAQRAKKAKVKSSQNDNRGNSDS